MQTTCDDPAAHISIDQRRRLLSVTFPDGRSVDIPADRLRNHCRCAICSRARIDNTFQPAAAEIQIDQVTPVGAYGVNIVFSDGHTRGIFPFAYLAELAAFRAVSAETLAKSPDDAG